MFYISETRAWQFFFNNISSYNHVNTHLVEGAKFFKFNFNVIHYYLSSIFGIAFLNVLFFFNRKPIFIETKQFLICGS